MERVTSVQKPHASTTDLLTWSDVPLPHSSATVSGHEFHSGNRSHQPTDGIRKVLFGGQVTDEEAESLNKRRPCSGYKLKEIGGNKIFAADVEDGTSKSATGILNSGSRTSVRIVQQAVNGISQISFSVDENVSLKKPTTVPEVAKQRELSGTLSDADNKINKQLSDAKCKELSGHDIFGPPSEAPPLSFAAAQPLVPKVDENIEEPAPRTVRTSVRVSNPAGGQSNILFGEEPEIKTTKKIHNQKFAELTGNGIFKGDVPPGSAEKPLSMAKLKEMHGSDIFADGKVESRDNMRGARKPPGGESSIALV
ncbi:hypothetical protein RJ639_046963 [Escallonia herrerae]|uniref:DUF4057 domain-containing protein n=1 Tax=Escallonia herrerae TaxID=1293975 RepID=A0AA88W4H3_9ASTE|nr:hypothetical protein RJ639_046963 [Escallonia herrerae]